MNAIEAKDLADSTIDLGKERIQAYAQIETSAGMGRYETEFSVPLSVANELAKILLADGFRVKRSDCLVSRDYFTVSWGV